MSTFLHLKERLDDTDAELRSLGQRVDGLEGRVLEVERALRDLRKRVDGLEPQLQGVVNTMAHEIGHAMGLAHPPQSDQGPLRVPLHAPQPQAQAQQVLDHVDAVQASLDALRAGLYPRTDSHSKGNNMTREDITRRTSNTTGPAKARAVSHFWGVDDGRRDRLRALDEADLDVTQWEAEFIGDLLYGDNANRFALTMAQERALEELFEKYGY